MSNVGPGKILNIMGAYMQSKILLVSNKIHLFDTIDNGEVSSIEIAKKLNLDQRFCKVLLDSLASIEILKKNGDLYSNSNDVKDFLLKDSPNYLGDLLLFQENEWNSWNNLYETIITGTPKGCDFSVKMKAEELETYIKAMDESGRYASSIIPALINLNKCDKLLDLGCGSGIFGASFLKRYPKLKVSFLDYPEVIELTKKYLKNYEDVNFIEANYHKYNFEENYDCIFCSHNIHENSEKENKILFRNVYNSLEKYGKFIIHDYIVDETEIRPVFSAVFSVNMVLQSGKGKSYCINEIKEWLKECGFKNVEYKPLGIHFPSSIVVAEKRESSYELDKK